MDQAIYDSIKGRGYSIIAHTPGLNEDELREIKYNSLPTEYHMTYGVPRESINAGLGRGFFRVYKLSTGRIAICHVRDMGRDPFGRPLRFNAHTVVLSPDEYGLIDYNPFKLAGFFEDENKGHKADGSCPSLTYEDLKTYASYSDFDFNVLLDKTDLIDKVINLQQRATRLLIYLPFDKPIDTELAALIELIPVQYRKNLFIYTFASDPENVEKFNIVVVPKSLVGRFYKVEGIRIRYAELAEGASEYTKAISRSIRKGKIDEFLQFIRKYYKKEDARTLERLSSYWNFFLTLLENWNKLSPQEKLIHVNKLNQMISELGLINEHTKINKITVKIFDEIEEIPDEMGHLAYELCLRYCDEVKGREENWLKKMPKKARENYLRAILKQRTDDALRYARTFGANDIIFECYEHLLGKRFFTEDMWREYLEIAYKINRLNHAVTVFIKETKYNVDLLFNILNGDVFSISKELLQTIIKYKPREVLRYAEKYKKKSIMLYCYKILGKSGKLQPAEWEKYLQLANRSGIDERDTAVSLYLEQKDFDLNLLFKVLGLEVFRLPQLDIIIRKKPRELLELAKKYNEKEIQFKCYRVLAEKRALINRDEWKTFLKLGIEQGRLQEVVNLYLTLPIYDPDVLFEVIGKRVFSMPYIDRLIKEHPLKILEHAKKYREEKIEFKCYEILAEREKLEDWERYLILAKKMKKWKKVVMSYLEQGHNDLRLLLRTIGDEAFKSKIIEKLLEIGDFRDSYIDSTIVLRRIDNKEIKKYIHKFNIKAIMESIKERKISPLDVLESFIEKKPDSIETYLFLRYVVCKTEKKKLNDLAKKIAKNYSKKIDRNRCLVELSIIDDLLDSGFLNKMIERNSLSEKLTLGAELMEKRYFNEGVKVINIVLEDMSLKDSKSLRSKLVKNVINALEEYYNSDPLIIREIRKDIYEGIRRISDKDIGILLDNSPTDILSLILIDHDILEKLNLNTLQSRLPKIDKKILDLYIKSLSLEGKPS